MPAFMTVGICGAAGHAENYAAHGFAFVEPALQRFLAPESTEDIFRTNMEAVRRSGLPVPVANQFLPSRLKAVGPEVDQKAVLRYAATAFLRAEQVGIEHIVFGNGGARHISQGFSVQAAEEQFIGLLCQMAPMAQDHGITLCVEPLRQAETNFLNTVSETLEVIRAVQHPAVQLTFDIYHVTQQGHTSEDVFLAGTAIRHCHIAEDRGRRLPGVYGQDFTPFFAALKATGYRGRIAVEGRVHDPTRELPSAIRTITDQMARA